VLVGVAALLACNHFHVPLAKSGFFASLSLIFASEIGDKTFFIAALLAMRYGKLLSFLGSVFSLSLMTVISVVIGYAVQRVPSVVESSEIFGKYLSAASLLYFGLRSLYTAARSGNATAGDELIEAEEQVGKAEKEGTIKDTNIANTTPLASLMEIAGLIFVAEWGDRSMLATIALGAAQNPIGVAGGAILGHAVATCIAVVGGAALADRISEKTVNVIGGVLFILFAGATAMGVF
jgi:putative Ca2+/H+ antiporter (TMEM165/GDT1 family)